MAQVGFGAGGCHRGLGFLMKRAIFALLTAASIWAQAPATAQAPTIQPPAPTPQAAGPVVRQQEVYVRRFSAGVSILAALPAPTRNESLSQLYTTTPVLEIRSTNTPKSSMVGFGIVGQIAITDKWAVAIAPTVRPLIKMEALKVELTGSDNPNTVQDDREGTNYNVKTTAWFLDTPVLVRRYNKSRHERGARWFLEVGPRLRYAMNVKTTTEVQPPPNKGDKFTLHDPVSYRKRIIGASGGFGLQFIDDFGIRFVPEVRYTRWFGSNFGDITGRSKSDQIEIIFSLTF